MFKEINVLELYVTSRLIKVVLYGNYYNNFIDDFNNELLKCSRRILNADFLRFSEIPETSLQKS